MTEEELAHAIGAHPNGTGGYAGPCPVCLGQLEIDKEGPHCDGGCSLKEIEDAAKLEEKSGITAPTDITPELRAELHKYRVSDEAIKQMTLDEAQALIARRQAGVKKLTDSMQQARANNGNTHLQDLSEAKSAKKATNKVSPLRRLDRNPPTPSVRIENEKDFVDVPPQNVPYERGILGSIFYRPAAIDTAMSQITPSDFYLESHREIYKAMLKLAGRGELSGDPEKPIDVMTVESELKRAGLLELTGGSHYIAQIAASVPDSQHIEEYCRGVNEMALRRDFDRQLAKAREANHNGAPLAELITLSQKLAIVDTGVPEKPTTSKGGMVLVDEYLKIFAERAARPSVWRDTLYAAMFNLLVGRPWSGKSTFAAALLRAIVLAGNFMGRLCRRMNTGYLALERNGLEVAKLFGAWGIGDSVFFSDEIHHEDAVKYILNEIKKHQLSFVVIDHMQHATKLQNASDYAEVSNALKPYQDIARTTGCCILGLHHQVKPSREQVNAVPSDEDPIDVMGSEAFRGASDTLIEATTSKGDYYVRVHTRTGTDIRRMQVMIDFETGELTALDPLSQDIAEGENKIAEFLFQKGVPQTEKQIRDGVQAKTRILNTALRQAVSSGLLIRTGQGGAKDPFHYRLAADNGNNGNTREQEEQDDF